MKRNWKKVFSIMLVLIMTISLFAGCSKNSEDDLDNDASQSFNETDDSNSLAKAGKYTASAKGFGGDVTVDVTVEEDGSISSIEVTADSETPTIGGEAATKLVQKIIDSQSLGVDAVSGATVTSAAILAAVEDALTQAGIDVTSWKEKEIVKNGVDEEVTVDVVVVGAGGSGTAAALAAAETDAHVMIIEKTGTVGGNTRLASGFFAVGTTLQEEEGLSLSVDVAINRLLEFNHYLSNGPLTRAIVEKSADTVEWLQNYGMEFYLQQKTTQFAHENDEYAYKTYHKYVDSTAGFENIYKQLDEMGAELRVNTSLATLLTNEEGTVIGITATKEDGGILTVYAKSTVVCTGGFGANADKVAEITNGAYLNALGMPNNGEGIELMEEVGAIDLDGTPLLHACQLAESEVVAESNSDTLAGFSNSSLTQLLLSPLLWVDGSGTRFVNEDVVYDTAYWANAAYAVGGKYYFIVDKATLEDYTNGTSIRVSECGPGANLDPDDFVALADASVEQGTAFKGNSLEELALAAGMDSEELEATVDRYNQMVNNQKDTDYNKSVDSLKYTVESGEYYAFDCRAVFLGTIGGVKVNEKLEVINLDYNPIKGLYTAGTNAGGYYEGSGYPPYEGLACGFAWTSGRIAGENAAAYAR